jgi:urea carboxylase-associated protein 1
MPQGGQPMTSRGAVREDVIVPPGEPWSRRVSRGEILRIVDLQGQQAVDFICFNAHDMKETYDNTVTVRLASRPFLRKGDVLYSNLANPMFTIIEDTIGNHDTMCGCCSAEINYLRYKVKDTPSCRANFLRELARHGLDSRSLVPNINFFMHIPIDANGEFQIKAPLSRPGDHVDLAAEMDCLAVISNCPQILNPANNFNPTPVRMVTFAPA